MRPSATGSQQRSAVAGECLRARVIERVLGGKFVFFFRYGSRILPIGKPKKHIHAPAARLFAVCHLVGGSSCSAALPGQTLGVILPAPTCSSSMSTTWACAMPKCGLHRGMRKRGCHFGQHHGALPLVWAFRRLGAPLSRGRSRHPSHPSRHPYGGPFSDTRDLELGRCYRLPVLLPASRSADRLPTCCPTWKGGKASLLIDRIVMAQEVPTPGFTTRSSCADYRRESAN